MGDQAGLTMDRQFVLDMLPKNAVCAEIGVWEGGFSAHILESTTPRELHLIDPWAFQPSRPETWFGGKIAQTQDDMDARHRAVVQRFAERPEVTVHRTPSLEAVAGFNDGSFDWVYVDGDHSFEGCKADLDAYLPKVRVGGYLLGDDYHLRGVRRAVVEFVAEHPGDIEQVDLSGKPQRFSPNRQPRDFVLIRRK